MLSALHSPWLQKNPVTVIGPTRYGWIMLLYNSPTASGNPHACETLGSALWHRNASVEHKMVDEGEERLRERERERRGEGKERVRGQSEKETCRKSRREDGAKPDRVWTSESAHGMPHSRGPLFEARATPIDGHQADGHPSAHLCSRSVGRMVGEGGHVNGVK